MRLAPAVLAAATLATFAIARLAPTRAGDSPGETAPDGPSAWALELLDALQKGDWAKASTRFDGAMKDKLPPAESRGSGSRSSARSASSSTRAPRARRSRRGSLSS